MIGIVVILGVSWLLLVFIQEKGLLVLGFLPLKKALTQFSYGLASVMLIRAIILFFEAQFKSFEFTANPVFIPEELFNSFWYHLKSALTEELMYRGALLYILIQRIGPKKAIWITSLIFGVYHWFSYDMFGGAIVPMIYILLITGVAGFVWAYAYHKTNSMTMAIGMHLGSNFFLSLFLPNQPYGELLYSISGMAELSEWNQLYVALFSGLGPSVLMFFAIKLFIKMEEKFNDSKKALT
ncbi:MAG: CPBP family intramembrane metalloprotease [Roseivirga sp.]|uniref:CPBP family intramembrane glutamic endopeptidase n=1 Tax=Roseivirga sp. TaxID=1964215 RepID=UPI001B10DF42|nr:CPBP family intramembrane glutamic endopeptidase [Roseivirga sp.]MBO6496439.1 CPBP family intramembrane metalloprotease [Roseivirga sp.]